MLLLMLVIPIHNFSHGNTSSSMQPIHYCKVDSPCRCYSNYPSNFWVSSHNPLLSGERFHALLPRKFNKIKYGNPKMDRKIALRISVEAINDTLGTSRWVPSYLFFGSVQRFSAADSKLPDQQSPIDALVRARQEMAPIVSEMRYYRPSISSPYFWLDKKIR